MQLAIPLPTHLDDDLPHAPGTDARGLTWKTVPEAPDYLVSDHGHVVSLKRPEPHLMSATPISRQKPYLSLTLRTGGGEIHRTVHHLVWTAHRGDVPDGFQIHHADHDPLNNAVWNLRLMSTRDHTRHHAAKISARDAAHIKALRGVPADVIASAYGLTHSHVNSIKNGRSWSDIRPERPPARVLRRLETA